MSACPAATSPIREPLPARRPRRSSSAGGSTSAVLAGNRANSAGADHHRLGRHALTIADTVGTFRRKLGGGMVLEGWLRERRDAWSADGPDVGPRSSLE